MKNIYLPNILVSFQKAERALLTILLALFAFTVQAQVGIGTITPDASAQLDVQSTTKGILIPRMLDTERTGIASPATGLTVYQTNGATGFYYYDGVAWQHLKPTGPGTIIPFASGTPIEMKTAVGGFPEIGAAIGFGNSANGIPFINPLIPPIIDFSFPIGNINTNMAFSVPRAGAVTSISAFFSSNVSLISLSGSFYVNATLLAAPAGSNIFTVVPGGQVPLFFGGLVTIGGTAQATYSGLNFFVSAGDRLLLVFTFTETGIPNANILAGYASAGVEIK